MHRISCFCIKSTPFVADEICMAFWIYIYMDRRAAIICIYRCLCGVHALVSSSFFFVYTIFTRLLQHARASRDFNFSFRFHLVHKLLLLFFSFFIVSTQQFHSRRFSAQRNLFSLRSRESVKTKETMDFCVLQSLTNYTCACDMQTRLQNASKFANGKCVGIWIIRHVIRYLWLNFIQMSVNGEKY